MPYVEKEIRDDIDANVVDHAVVEVLTPGELNYLITSIIQTWADVNVSYDRLNAAHGTLYSVAAEFYRRKVAPYEDIKKAQNGDVYA